jgi:predicted MFS family arabinose efflux permease
VPHELVVVAGLGSIRVIAACACMPKAPARQRRAPRMASLLLPEFGRGRLLLVAQLLVSIEVGALIAGLTVYLYEVAGLRAEQIGLGLFLASIAGLVAVPLAGAWADRRGHQRTAVAAGAAATLAISAYVLVDSLAALVLVEAGATIALLSMTVSLRALATTLFDRPLWLRYSAFERTLINVGLPIGALLAVVPLGTGSRGWYVALFLAIAAGVGVATLCIRLVGAPGGGAAAAPLAPRRTTLLVRDLPYVTMALLFGLLFSRNSVLAVAIPLWIVTSAPLPRSAASMALVANTVFVVALQVRVARSATTLSSARRVTAGGGACLALSCLTIALCPADATLAAAVALAGAVVLLTAGEMLTSAGEWTYSYELADPRAQGRYQSVFVFGHQLGLLIGPLLATTLCIGLGAPGWALLGLVFLLAGAALWAATPWAVRTTAARDEASHQRTINESEEME